MSARFVTGKVLGSLATLFFVICFNFFLFRVVEGDPVASLFRGRNLTATQREALTKQFGLDGSTGEQFVRYLEQTAQLNLGRSYSTNQPVSKEIASKAWATIALVGISTLLSTVFGVLIGIAAAWRRRTKADYIATDVHDGDVLDAGLLARDAAAVVLRRHARLVPGRRHRGPDVERDRARAPRRPGQAHVPARA